MDYETVVSADSISRMVKEAIEDAGIETSSVDARGGDTMLAEGVIASGEARVLLPIDGVDAHDSNLLKFEIKPRKNSTGDYTIDRVNVRVELP